MGDLFGVGQKIRPRFYQLAHHRDSSCLVENPHEGQIASPDSPNDEFKQLNLQCSKLKILPHQPDYIIDYRADEPRWT